MHRPIEARDRRVARAFGPVLRALRRERALSQEVLAEKAGCHRNNISLMERGEQNPSLLLFFDLAAALEISPMELIARVQARVNEAEIG